LAPIFYYSLIVCQRKENPKLSCIKQLHSIGSFIKIGCLHGFYIYIYILSSYFIIRNNHLCSLANYSRGFFVFFFFFGMKNNQLWIDWPWFTHKHNFRVKGTFMTFFLVYVPYDYAICDLMDLPIGGIWYGSSLWLVELETKFITTSCHFVWKFRKKSCKEQVKFVFIKASYIWMLFSTLCSDLWLGWGPKQTCISFWELSNVNET
jgi:hypothetical protein